MVEAVTKWTEGDVLDFDNGGRIRIAWTDEHWIGFATYLPGEECPVLRRMTREDFDASLDMTPAKIVKIPVDARTECPHSADRRGE